MRAWKLLITFTLLLSGAWYAWSYSQSPNSRPAQASLQGRALERPQLIHSAVVQLQDVPRWIEREGYAQAFEQIELRPQVSGRIAQVAVREGSEVKAGALLFVLDDREAQAEVRRSQAALERDQAQLAEAELQLQRQEELLTRRLTAQSTVDTAVAQVRTLRATVAATRASLENAQVLLGYSQIRAPFSGRVGAIDLHVGSYVQPSGTALTTLSQLDPISVSFTITESEWELLRSLPDPLQAHVTLLEQPQISGRLSFIDSAIDNRSGTLRLKAQLPNLQRQLWPGQYVRLRLQVGLDTQVALLPNSAVVYGPQGRFVYVIDQQQRVSAQPVQVLRVQGAQALLSGLAAGTRVVVEGGQNLRPGSVVSESKSGG